MRSQPPQTVTCVPSWAWPSCRSPEFRVSPDAYPAHLSLLFDVFPAGEVGVARATLMESISPIHGLVQDFQVEYRDDESTVSWTRQPRHGAAVSIRGAEELTDLLSVLPSLLSSATATVSTGETGLALRPVITLALDTEDRGLLHQVHEVTDWVLTVDRNMGIEFFDHGGFSDRPDYLIDHTPGVAGSINRNLTITSRSVAELEAILTPVLEQYHLTAEGRHAVAVLDQLRSLSGRLALKLISSPRSARRHSDWRCPACTWSIRASSATRWWCRSTPTWTSIGR